MIDKILKNHKTIKIILITFIWLLFIAILSFSIVFIFTDKYIWTVKETIIISVISLFALVIPTTSLLISSKTKRLNAICNSLIEPDTFNINGKDSYNIIKNSNYRTVNSLLYSNELKYKTDDYEITRSEITIIEDEFHKEYAYMYFFKTSDKFKEHYLLSRSLNIKGFDKFKRESLGNTIIYYNNSIEINKMNVEFANNFYISFKDDTILFIDFNKKNFDFEKEKVTNERFKEYIFTIKEEIQDVYNNLIKLH